LIAKGFLAECQTDVARSDANESFFHDGKDLTVWPYAGVESRLRDQRHELEESSTDDAQRAALTAASDRCERIAAATINPTALLDEFRKAIAVLEDDTCLFVGFDPQSFAATLSAKRAW